MTEMQCTLQQSYAPTSILKFLNTTYNSFTQIQIQIQNSFISYNT